MANLFQGVRNLFGNAVAGVGSTLGLPEMGISERVQGVPNFQYASPSVLGAGSSNVVYGPYGPSNPARTPTTNRQIQQPQQPQQPSGPNQPDYNAQLDEIYNPIRDFLNQMEAEYTAGQPEAEKQVGTSFERALTPINEQEATQLASQNKQEGVVNTSEQNALAQARQVYNELQQRNVSLYGTGSSAGPAASEILGRETAKQFGQVGEAATQGRVAIEEERGVIKKFAAQKRTDLEQQKQEAIRNVQKEFRAGLLQINQMRAQNESAKASARLELLQQAQQQAFQIEQANTAYQRAIDQFEREKSATLQANAAYQSTQTFGPETASRINQIVSGPGSYAQKATAILSTPGIPTNIANTIIGQLSKKEDDELGNPFETRQ